MKVFDLVVFWSKLTLNLNVLTLKKKKRNSHPTGFTSGIWISISVLERFKSQLKISSWWKQ